MFVDAVINRTKERRPVADKGLGKGPIGTGLPQQAIFTQLAKELRQDFTGNHDIVLTLLFPLQFDLSARHDQPTELSEPFRMVAV